MDIELFQWVLLGLLALGVVVLAALLATLGGIKKALEERSSDARPLAAGAGASASTSSAADEHTGESAAASGYGTYPTSETTEAQAPAVEAAPAAETSTATTGSPRQADTIRSVLEQHGLSDAPTAGDSGAGEPAEEHSGVVDSVFAAHADDPQEEPFQRDGRWWFRRGDELLLYDETSGQWQPAPDTGTPQDAQATPAGATGGPAGSSAAAGVQTTPVSATPAVADQVATFWKCPTCGAVNGSTAATCRMCFAARP